MPAVQRAEVLAKLAEAKTELQAQFGVRRLGLFGSCARGSNTGASDVDLLVDVDPAIGLDFVVLADRLEQLVGAHVDLVSDRTLTDRARRHLEGEIVYV